MISNINCKRRSKHARSYKARPTAFRTRLICYLSTIVMSAQHIERLSKKNLNGKRNMNLKRSARSAYLLMLLTTAYLTGFTQDSTRLVPVKAWQLSRMIQEVVVARVCDSLVQRQSLALASADSVINNLDKRVQLLDSQIKTYSQISDSWQRSYALLHVQATNERKAARKQGRKEGVVLSAVLAIILIAVF